MSDCRFGVSPVNYPDPDPDQNLILSFSRANGVFCVIMVKIYRLVQEIECRHGSFSQAGYGI